MKYIKADKLWQNENESIVVLCGEDGSRVFFDSSSYSEHVDAFNLWIEEGNVLGKPEEYYDEQQ